MNKGFLGGTTTGTNHDLQEVHPEDDDIVDVPYTLNEPAF